MQIAKHMKSFLLLITFVFSTSLFAQTGKEIIDRSIELSGGITNWKLLNTVAISGKVTLGVNDEYPIKIFQARPNLSKTSIIIANKENIVEGYDGENGYAMNYATNKLERYPNYNAESFDTDFIDFESKGFSAQLLGREKVGTKDCYKVELTKNVNKTIYFFDVKNYQLLKEIQKDETLIYGDYKKVGNLLFPYRIESSSSKKDSDYVILVQKIETNKVFPKNTFKF